MTDTDPGLGAGLQLAGPMPGRPSSPTVPCPGCGAPVDPLRAERVTFVRRFFYFCGEACLLAFDATSRPSPGPRRPLPARALAVEGATQTPRAVVHGHPAAVALAGVGRDDLDEVARSRVARPSEPGPTVEAEPILEAPLPPADVGGVLLGLAVAGGLLSVALALAGSTPVATGARVALAVAAGGALVAQTVMGRRDASEAHAAPVLAAPVVSVVAALVARVVGDANVGDAATLAGLVVASAAATISMVRRSREPLEHELGALAAALAVGARRTVGDESSTISADDVRPGEEIVVEAGELVPVDATITAGSADVAPWFGARHVEARAEGDAVVAGARVHEGRLRAVAGWTGLDRAWARLALDPRRRADVHAPLARWGHLVVERAGLVGATLGALAAYAAGQNVLGVVMVAAAVYASIAHAGTASVASLHVTRGILAGLRRGVAFRSAEAFDRAGRVACGAFCARGTLLVGEPEVASAEPYAQNDADQVLALASGAESGGSHPAARALVRAARERGIRPDAVRSLRIAPGLGVLGVSSGGEALVVGSRALMLRERVSVAAAETRITDLEAMGRTVVLVALAGRLVGMLALQDGLRPGARAAVQHLLDVGVEPVLLSGDSRETCEALGRVLDVSHVRPDVLPTERADEIRRLADSGAVVAVLGRSPADDAALGAADVAVALATAGSPNAEWHVQLASDSVRDAGLALKLAHVCRSEARLAILVVAGTGGAVSVGIAFGLLPGAAGPLAAIASTVVALARFRSRG